MNEHFAEETLRCHKCGLNWTPARIVDFHDETLTDDHNFPPAGYVRIDKPRILRTDTEGRDVTNLPGLWSEDDTITDLSQPFTVEWLCEIGGADCGESIAFRDADGWLLLEFFIGTREWWIYNQAEIPKERQPKTRGDVLKWLDVLGIVPATTKVAQP